VPERWISQPLIWHHTKNLKMEMMLAANAAFSTGETSASLRA
jgi:hypothetical protein